MSDKIKEVIDALRKNGMTVFYFTTADEARAKVLEMIPARASVGIGGSVTVRQLGLIDALAKRGHDVFDHWQSGLNREEILQIKKAQLQADYFVSSSNAVTSDGKLVNIDNTGNRVAALIFGPKHVLVIVGINKIVADVAAGIQRIKDRVAPLNTQRRQDQTPCAQGKGCRDCNSPDRICRVTSIIEKKTKGVESFTVILVGEELGY
jgi:L-lactate utilization protein LutB